jgi:hypothetical protein
MDSSDSGVVNRTSGCSRACRRRSDCFVSPCRIAADRPSQALDEAIQHPDLDADAAMLQQVRAELDERN